MKLPNIRVTRYQPGLYGWELQQNGGPRLSEIGINTVRQCLERAVRAVPMETPWVELHYCALFAGLVPRSNLVSDPDMYAQDMVNQYARLLMR